MPADIRRALGRFGGEFLCSVLTEITMAGSIETEDLLDRPALRNGNNRHFAGISTGGGRRPLRSLDYISVAQASTQPTAAILAPVPSRRCENQRDS